MSDITTPPTDVLLTGADLLAMGEVGACELIDGRLVPMNPPGGEHGRIEIRLGRYLDEFVEQRQLGWVVGGETGLYIRHNPDTVRGVDLAFISRQRLPAGVDAGYLDVAPELVVEIISPSDHWGEIEAKLADYFSAGVGQVWVVQPAQQQVYVCRTLTERHLLQAGDTLHGEGVLDGFSVPLDAIFKS